MYVLSNTICRPKGERERGRETEKERKREREKERKEERGR